MGFFSACKNTSSNKDARKVSDNNSINFSTVDTSPSFKKCENFLDQEKTDCFRITIQEKFTQYLEEYSFITEESIEETIDVVLHIDRIGNMKIKEIKYSKEISLQLPNLTKDLSSIVAKMPKLLPATKRGIPVATEYQLPIHIKTSDFK